MPPRSTYPVLCVERTGKQNLRLFRGNKNGRARAKRGSRSFRIRSTEFRDALRLLWKYFRHAFYGDCDYASYLLVPFSYSRLPTGRLHAATGNLSKFRGGETHTCGSPCQIFRGNELPISPLRETERMRERERERERGGGKRGSYCRTYCDRAIARRTRRN